jgi:hypothetical protein
MVMISAWCRNRSRIAVAEGVANHLQPRPGASVVKLDAVGGLGVSGLDVNGDFCAHGVTPGWK